MNTQTVKRFLTTKGDPDKERDEVSLLLTIIWLGCHSCERVDLPNQQIAHVAHHVTLQVTAHPLSITLHRCISPL